MSDRWEEAIRLRETKEIYYFYYIPHIFFGFKSGNLEVHGKTLISKKFMSYFALQKCHQGIKNSSHILCWYQCLLCKFI